MTAPPGTYARLAPRSGLAAKHSLDVGAGVIDRDYGGVRAVILFNLGDVPYEVKLGDRVAQLIFEKISTSPIVEGKVEVSGRDPAGFGSSGKSGLEVGLRIFDRDGLSVAGEYVAAAKSLPPETPEDHKVDQGEPLRHISREEAEKKEPVHG